MLLRVCSFQAASAGPRIRDTTCCFLPLEPSLPPLPRVIIGDIATSLMGLAGSGRKGDPQGLTAAYLKGLSVLLSRYPTTFPPGKLVCTLSVAQLCLKALKEYTADCKHATRAGGAMEALGKMAALEDVMPPASLADLFDVRMHAHDFFLLCSLGCAAAGQGRESVLPWGVGFAQRQLRRDDLPPWLLAFFGSPLCRPSQSPWLSPLLCVFRLRLSGRAFRNCSHLPSAQKSCPTSLLKLTCSSPTRRGSRAMDRCPTADGPAGGPACLSRSLASFKRPVLSAPAYFPARNIHSQQQVPRGGPVSGREDCAGPPLQEPQAAGASAASALPRGVVVAWQRLSLTVVPGIPPQPRLLPPSRSTPCWAPSRPPSAAHPSPPLVAAPAAALPRPLMRPGRPGTCSTSSPARCSTGRGAPHTT